MLKDEKAIVVFSGGQDSTTCLFWALKTFKEVEVVTFNIIKGIKLKLSLQKKMRKI